MHMHVAEHSCFNKTHLFVNEYVVYFTQTLVYSLMVLSNSSATCQRVQNKEKTNANRQLIAHEVWLNDAIVLTNIFTEAQKYRLQRHLQCQCFCLTACIHQSHGIQ